MSDIVSIHDNFIRSVLSDKSIAVDYFRSYFPEYVSEQLDFNTLRQLPDVYVSGELKKSMSDIVYSCGRKDSKDEVKVSLLIEHKSYVDDHTPVQIGSYIFSGRFKQIRNKEKLSPIIPILPIQRYAKCLRLRLNTCQPSGRRSAASSNWDPGRRRMRQINTTPYGVIYVGWSFYPPFYYFFNPE